MSMAAVEANLSDDERAGLELIRESGGIHQSDFWKELDVSSRKGSRIVESLFEKDMIQREDTVYEGHNTYYLTLLMAGDQLSPFVGDEEVDPNSDAFSQWVMNLAYEE